MANLMLAPASWSDGTNAPPSQWTGTAYEFLIGGTITFTGAVNTGDTLDFVASVPVGTPHYNYPLAVTVNGVDQSYGTAAEPYDVHIALSAGDTVSITAMSGEAQYHGDVVLSQVIPKPCKRLQFEVQMTGDDEDA